MTDTIKIIAILDRADGNESVGTMWQETAVFEQDTPIKDVITWAMKVQYQHHKSYEVNTNAFRGKLTLTIGQKP